MSQFTALKSTTKSREHEFEADSDDLEDGISHSFPTFPPARTSPKPPTITLQGPDRNSFVQASPDESDHEDLDDLSYAPHPGALNSQIRLRGSPEPEQPLLRPLHTAAATFDAELQEFKQTKAGSFMSGVFNQANSIVGAGIVGQ